MTASTPRTPPASATPPPPATPSPTPPHATLLRTIFSPEALRQQLLPRDSWHPFPTRQEREPWQALPESQRTAIIKQAETHLGMAWPELPATLFLEYRRNGNRSRYEAPHFARRIALAQLVLGECVEGQGRFLDDIINGVWALCEESFWGVPAHSYSPRFPETGLPDTAYRVVDLFAAETGALLAWTQYLVGQAIAPELPVVEDRIVREVEHRLLEPYRTVDDWRWFGISRRPVNNWNPWIHSNLLAATLLLEPDEDTRRATVERIVMGLDYFLEGYHADGGCDEGPSYWGRAGASLFDNLELLLSATGGQLSAYDQPLVQAIGRYIYRMHVGGPWYVNFADASAKVPLDADLVYRYGKRIGDQRMMAHGAYAAHTSAARTDRPTSLTRALPALFNEAELEHAPDRQPPLIKQVWLDGIEVLVARDREGTTEGLFLAAKGGHNAESHNHNDVGQFVVALDGHPVLIDVGVETYTRKTFSADRYDIWTMQSLYHNLPAINGQGQEAGREFAAQAVQADVQDQAAQLTLDLAAAYPEALGVERWHRTVRLERRAGAAGGAGGAGAAASGIGSGGAGRVILTDEYALRQTPQSLALHLMASGPVETTEGVLRCASPTRPLLVEYDAGAFAAQVETIPINDARLAPVWGERVYRVVLQCRRPAASGSWTLTMRAGE